MLILAGDVGGTKTVLAVYSSDGGSSMPVTEATYASHDYPSLEALVTDFLHTTHTRVERACFGVAGPVVDGRVRVTNVPWVVDERDMSAALRTDSVSLINDLDAVAHAIPILEPSDLLEVNHGDPEERGPLAVVAPGTGLGEAYLTWENGRYRSHDSEGGHTDFGPRTPVQCDLLRYLRERFEHVSYERVCSGIGIPNLYYFLRDTGRADEPAWLAERLAGAHDIVPVIAAAAVGQEPVALCAQTLDLFVAILGAEVGNVALKIMATGGLYVGGGIAPHMLDRLRGPEFMEAFVAKGRFAELLRRMPVRIILHPKPALMGAAHHALEHLRA